MASKKRLTDEAIIAALVQAGSIKEAAKKLKISEADIISEGIIINASVIICHQANIIKKRHPIGCLSRT